ncbi:MAG: DUF4469 domain-containing protein [Spirochaetales bacterium]|nr:DUF4469 domain-containing protein [Spirochaetales bacterium]
MATSKTLGYALYRNNLKGDGSDQRYYARINSRGMVKEKELIDAVVGKNSTVTREEVGAVLGLLAEVIREKIQGGFNVNTRIFKTNLSMHGVFEDDDDEYEKERHQVRLNFRESSEMKTFIDKELSLEKYTSDERNPRIISIYDVASNTKNQTLTPGNVAVIRGKNLSVDAQDEQQGVFFINEESGAQFRSAEVRSASNLKMMFMLPADLASGSYRVKIRCGYGKSVREADLADPVSVA